MDLAYIKEILNGVKNGDVDVDEAVGKFKNLPFEDLDFAKVDHHRNLRNGYPEVIYCQGKTPFQVKKIVESLMRSNNNILATRAEREVYEAVKEITDDSFYHEMAKVIVVKQREIAKMHSKCAVVSAGTSDMSVAEEAAITAETLGCRVDRIYDVGVAGIHRLFANMERLNTANVIVVVAGMEGALASVVGGMVDKPVVAVPTSIGYGASFGGLSALLTMLNSCASGVAVVNIDNGFGAGYYAATILRGLN